jgi:peptide/nickel transport system permease protein
VIRFLLTRAAMLVAILAVASVAIHGSMLLAPGDPATLLVGGGKQPSPELIASIHREYHLDDPFAVRYWRWLVGALQGDFGPSLAYRDSVNHLLAERISNTLTLVGYASVIILLAGITLGTVAALRGGRFEVSVIAISAGAMAVPTFVIGALLAYVFGVRLSWFAPSGSGSGISEFFRYLTLPAIALAFSWIGYVAQITRTSVRSELRSEHVETADSRGIPRPGVIRRHVLRNASGPIFAVSGIAVAGLIATTAVVEKAFGISGIGALLVDAAAKQDLATVQAISLIMVASFVVLNTLVDLVTALLDPRVLKRRPS